MKLFTEVPLSDIDEMSRLEGASLNEVKTRLADEATAMLHGKSCLASIHQTTAVLYSSQSGSKEALTSLPTLEVSGGSITLLDALVQSSLASSKSDARRQIACGAVRLNGNQIMDAFAIVTNADISENGAVLKLSSGKKKHVVLLFRDTDWTGSNENSAG